MNNIILAMQQQLGPGRPRALVIVNGVTLFGVIAVENNAGSPDELLEARITLHCKEFRTVEVTPEMPPHPTPFRELRLWHWEQCLRLRKWAQESRELSGAESAGKNDDTAADQHLRFVQVLNDLFPVGDTAEQDANLAIRANTVRYSDTDLFKVQPSPSPEA